MPTAYVDSSALVAIAMNEERSAEVESRLDGFSRLLSSILLDAEVRSAFAREQRLLETGVRAVFFGRKRAFEERLLSRITWVLPDRSLTEEIDTALDAGYLRGADLLHAATALYAARGEQGMTFLSLDRRLREVAGALGFQV